MIIFLYGPDDFRRLKKREFVVGQFLEKHPGGAVAVFGGENGGLEKISTFLLQESLFEEKKLGMVSDMELYPGIEKILKGVIKEKNTTLILESKKAPPKSSFLLKEPVISENFPRLTGAEWKKFLANQAKKLGVGISVEALTFLSEIFEGDSWAATTELQKLSSFGKEISAHDLTHLGLGVSPEFWQLFSGARSGILKERLKTLATLQAQNEPAAKTFNMLSSLWGEKIPQFAEYDVSIKSGRLEYEEALLGLALG